MWWQQNEDKSYLYLLMDPEWPRKIAQTKTYQLFGALGRNLRGSMLKPIDSNIEENGRMNRFFDGLPAIPPYSLKISPLKIEEKFLFSTAIDF